MVVSEHAIARWKLRTGSTRSDAVVERRILTALANAREVWVKRKYRALQLLNHGLREARYYRTGDLILVVEGEVIKTVHSGDAGRWTDRRDQ